MTTVNGCDYGHEAKATRLDIGGNAGVFLCRKHWGEEMMWRKLRNEELEPQNRFDILPYPEDDSLVGNRDRFTFDITG